jgi:glycosyltransferase involved in cell wall biosynthesis
VSIIIAAFNCEATVEATIQSCLAQTLPSVEVVVVDDGSTDGTAAKLQSFGNRISVVSQANRGLAAARNVGLATARGRFIAWMDADDLCAPERLAAQSHVLEANPDAVLVSSDFSAFAVDADYSRSYIGTYYGAVGRSGVDEIYPQPAQGVPSGEKGSLVSVRLGSAYPRILFGNFVHPPTVMVRREAIEYAGIFDEELRYASDYELIIRLSKLGKFAYIDTPLLRYRISDGQMSGARNMVAVRLESAGIVSRALASDRERLAPQSKDLELHLARMLVKAAQQIGYRDRSLTLSLVARSWRHRVLWRESAFALLHVLPPDAIVPLLRRLRS